MRIAFDATPLARAKSGIGYHVEFLVSAIARTGECEEILLFSNREPVFDGVVPPSVRWPRRHLFPNRAPWMQFLLPQLIREEKPDLVHYVNFNAPILLDHPFVVTFHDMALFGHPEFFTWKKRILTRSLMPFVGRRARGILTVSETVKDEIVERLGIARDRIFVVPPAPADIYRPVGDSALRDAVLSRHGVKAPYVLFVGTLEPRKNLAGLLQAFDLLKGETGFPHTLVVIGGRGWMYGPILRTIEGLAHKGEIHILDYVSLEEMPALYTAAEALVFPSFYEGFGVPPLEAMRCGTPAVVSDIPVMREIMGDAALFVDPHRPESIAAGIRHLLTDAPLAVELKRRGLLRGDLYTWDRSARGALDAYRAVLGKERSASAANRS
jgi:glycosyltransferase involved in cell wall biosynthesis